MANLTPSNIPESARMFFASVSSPAEILLSNFKSFSHSSPRRILAILDWDFGGSHALPLADEGFDL
jgi:hypothetical protein